MFDSNFECGNLYSAFRLSKCILTKANSNTICSCAMTQTLEAVLSGSTFQWRASRPTSTTRSTLSTSPKTTPCSIMAWNRHFTPFSKIMAQLHFKLRNKCAWKELQTANQAGIGLGRMWDTTGEKSKERGVPSITTFWHSLWIGSIQVIGSTWLTRIRIPIRGCSHLWNPSLTNAKDYLSKRMWRNRMRSSTEENRQKRITFQYRQFGWEKQWAIENWRHICYQQRSKQKRDLSSRQ